MLDDMNLSGLLCICTEARLLWLSECYRTLLDIYNGVKSTKCHSSVIRSWSSKFDINMTVFSPQWGWRGAWTSAGTVVKKFGWYIYMYGNYTQHMHWAHGNYWDHAIIHVCLYIFFVNWTHGEQISMKFSPKYNNFHSRKCVWKCHLENQWRPFCLSLNVYTQSLLYLLMPWILKLPRHWHTHLCNIPDFNGV